MCKDRNGNYINCNGGKPSLPRKKPSILRQAQTAGGALLQMGFGLTDKCSEELYKARLSVCSSCDSIQRFNSLPKGADVGVKDRCIECGCFLRIKAYRKPKNGVSPAFWDCPLNKWADIEENIVSE